MQPTDIARLVTLGSPTLSPDGRHAVVAATRADLDENDYRSSLWIVATDGSAPPRRLTHGAHDAEPRYSPDGSWLAYLGRRGEGKAQLQLLPVAGGEAREITDLPLGAGAPRWSADSSAIAFVARVPDTDRYGTNEKVPAEKEPPRRITGLAYRFDNLGFLVDRRSHVHVVDVRALVEADDTADGPGDLGAYCRQVTSGDADDSGVEWTSGGDLLFLSARHDNREHDRVQDVHVVGRDGGGQRQLTDGSLSVEAVAVTDDPGTLLVAGDPQDAERGWLARNVGLWRVRVGDTPARPERLTDTESVHLGAMWIVPDGDRALVAVENRGAVDLVAVDLDGTGHTTVAAGPRQVTGADRAGGVTVVAYTDTTTSGELARIGDGGELVSLTDFGADARPVLRPITELEATAPDGYPVHGFLAVPDGDGPHPVLLMIHGGPFAQYGWTNLDEAQVYAAAGYAVVYGNPRGSSGYGEAHGRYIVGDVGARQAPDLFALLEAALERPELDASRLGVLGGSHGGFMTTWLIGHDHRFRAALSERAVNAIDSFEGSSDIGWDFADQLYGTDPEQRRVQSPLTYADEIRTPLLIVHSEHDWRCPIEQAQRLYVALRKRDAEVEMLLFPGEGHELSRSGVPSHRVARFEAVLDWFGRYLTHPA